MKLGGFSKLKTNPLIYLIFKAAIFGAVWYFLPFWAFLIVGFYFYFVPFFRSAELSLPFAIILFLAATEEKSISLALVFSVLFYITIGAKDFVLINRHIFQQVLSFVVAFLLLIKFFSLASSWGAHSVFYSLLVPLVLFGLMRGILTPKVGDEAVKRDILLGTVSFLMWQFLLVLMFLPIDRFYQSSLALIFAVLLFEITFGYLSGNLGRRNILIYFSVFLVFFSLILGLAKWGLR